MRGAGRDFYIRQLRDMKFSPDPACFTAEMLRGYALLCGRTLARAHARGGHAVAMSAYLGTSDKFDRGVRDFAVEYVGQVESDYAAYKAAIADGSVSLGNAAEESSYVLTLDPGTGVTVSVRSPAAVAPGPESSGARVTRPATRAVIHRTVDTDIRSLNMRMATPIA